MYYHDISFLFKIEEEKGRRKEGGQNGESGKGEENQSINKC